MTKPLRLQLSRKKGFDLQALSRAANGLEAVSVARPTIFGNPCTCSRPYGCPHHPDFERFAWEDDKGNVDPLRCCVDVFRHYVEAGLKGEPTHTGRLSFALDAEAGYPRRAKLIAALPSLAGKNLACWCKPGDRCHADVLLELCASAAPLPTPNRDLLELANRDPGDGRPGRVPSEGEIRRRYETT